MTAVAVPPPPIGLPPPPKFKSTPPARSGGINFLEELKKNTTETKPVEELPPEILYQPKSDLFSKVICPRCEKEVLEDEYPTHTTSHSNEIFPHIYLGAQRNANNKKELTVRTDVTDILNLTEEVENYFDTCPKGCPCEGGNTSECWSYSKPDFVAPAWFTYTRYRIKDKSGENIYPIFHEAFLLIEKVREKENGRILVHCVQGISRSASVVISYVMRYRSWCLRKAFEHVKSCRPLVCPNAFFIKQLQLYEKHLIENEHLKLEGYPPPIDEYHGPSLTVEEVHPPGKIQINSD